MSILLGGTPFYGNPGGGPNYSLGGWTTTLGNLAAVEIILQSTVTGPAISGITDNKGNQWVSAGNGFNSFNTWCEIWYAPNCTAGITGLTVVTTVPPSNFFYYAFFDCVGANVNPLEQPPVSLTGQSATTNPVGPAITTLSSGGIVLSMNSPGEDITAVASPFTIVGTAPFGFAYYLTPLPATYSPSWTQNSSASWGGSTVAFKPTSSTFQIDDYGQVISFR